MSTTPRTPSDPAVPATAEPAETGSVPVYETPRLIEYGPLAKITQGSPGSTGETTNMLKRKCL
jgi:hypothetical protein